MAAEVIDAEEVQLRRFARESLLIVDGLSEEHVRLLLCRLILAVRVFKDPELASDPSSALASLWELTRLLYADVTEDQELVDALEDGLQPDVRVVLAAVLERFRELIPYS